MKEIIKNLLDKKTHCIFVSPHLDDAVFSAGEGLMQLAGNTKVDVVNVMTGYGDGKNSLSARMFLKQCRSKSARELLSERVDEDAAALQKVNIVPINLGVADALWRSKKVKGIRKAVSKILPEADRIYPTYKLHIIKGNVSISDKKVEKLIADTIHKIVGSNKNFTVFAPAGFGNHVDHVLVRDAVRKSFENKAIYWADVPYATRKERNPFIERNNLKKLSLGISSSKKNELCKMYKTQYSVVMSQKGISKRSELYFLKI